MTTLDSVSSDSPQASPYNYIWSGPSLRRPELCVDLDERTADGFIYFVQGENGGPVKIGITSGPRGENSPRMADLQTTHPDKLVWRGDICGTYRREAFLHTIFAPWRLQGEWFRASAIVARYTGCIPDPGEDVESAVLPYTLIGLFDQALPLPWRETLTPSERREWVEIDAEWKAWRDVAYSDLLRESRHRPQQCECDPPAVGPTCFKCGKRAAPPA